MEAPSFRIQIPMALLGVLMIAPAAIADTPIARIDDLRHEGLYRASFSLLGDTEVEIEAVFSGWAEEKEVFAYPWILDLRSREVVWMASAQEARETREEHNLSQSSEMTLPAGDYALYFSAHGGMFPIRKKVKLLKLFDLGSISIDGKFPVKWDEYGDPDEWYVEIRDKGENQPGQRVAPVPREPDLGAILRIARVGNIEYHCAALDLSQAVRVRVLAVGEYAGSGRGFCDGAWILERDRCERIWEMTLENTDPAGGAEKNRRFDREVTLGPGRFLICYGSDDSHSYEEWNSPPPFDPESWGITLIPIEGPAPGVVRVQVDPREENLIASLRRVGDAAYLREGFTLTHPADLCIRALGEKKHGEDRMVDFGWIEDARTLRAVWTMEFNVGVYASGEIRNRLIEDHVHLPEGSYYVCYVTDGSHSPVRWYDHPPFDPDGWGIVVRGSGADFKSDWVHELSPGDLDRAVISLAPMRDNQHKSVRFAVQQPTRVRLIALGEGDRRDMYDYGWLENDATGEKIWQMRYPDTSHAGGAHKNRRIERVVTLEPGSYALHYRTDDSHSFGDWNAAAPEEPYHWGITMVELPPE